MFSKVSVLVPTRGRVERLRTLLESFGQTVYHGRAELVFRVDDDDVATQEFLMSSSDNRRWRMIVGPRLDGYASMATYFNELYAAATGDVLMCGNDDMVFLTPAWNVAILNEANRYPDGVFDFGVLTHNAENFPFATVSKMACDKLGFLFDPRIFWGDIFWRDIAVYFGRALPLPSVSIAHDWAGFKPDAVFLAGEGARRADHMQFHGVAVAEAVEKLRGEVA